MVNRYYCAFCFVGCVLYLFTCVRGITQIKPNRMLTSDKLLLETTTYVIQTEYASELLFKSMKKIIKL